MKFFDLFKKKNNSEPPIPESEKKYYQPDSYYTQTDIRGADVITFEERKKTSTISRNGLYVAEILLLQYVSYGTYPHPNNGYPGFWWFEYGIRNVGARLQSLEERGFIRISTPLENVSRLTVPQLKEILNAFDLPINGKKDDLVQRIKENLSDNDVNSYITERKYTLTDLGKSELSENEYVPIMHKSPDKTTENSMFGPIFNVWEVNRRLAKNPDWHTIIEDIRREQAEYQAAKFEKHKILLKEMEKHDPEFAAKLREWDEKDAEFNRNLEAEKLAEETYKTTGNIDDYISFWEKQWEKGELHLGSQRAFILPNLYIKQKRYDDALRIINLIDPFYQEKKEAYINKIQALKEKEAKNLKNSYPDNPLATGQYTIEQYSVANSLKICRESIKIIYETTNPDTFFSRYEIVLRETANIEAHSDKFNFGNLSPQTMRQEVVNGKQKYVRDMIDRYWNETVKGAESLKTDNGKKNRYQKFYDTLERYKNEISEENIIYYTAKYRSALFCLK